MSASDDAAADRHIAWLETLIKELEFQKCQAESRVKQLEGEVKRLKRLAAPPRYEEVRKQVEPETKPPTRWSLLEVD